MRHAFANRILAGLDADEGDAVRSFLTPTPFPVRSTVNQADIRIVAIHFLESGLASVVTPKDDIVEVGIVGDDGFIGWPHLLGLPSHPFRTFMQIAGEGYTLPTDQMPAAFAAAPSLRGLMLRYIGVQLVQVAQVAACNAKHAIRQRLARWLLMSQDLIHDDAVPMTHELLSFMLSVRRPTVGGAIQELEKAGAVRQRHGRIVIVDRAKLEATACTCYGVIHTYARLLDRKPHPKV